MYMIVAAKVVCIIMKVLVEPPTIGLTPKLSCEGIKIIPPPKPSETPIHELKNRHPDR